MDCQSSGFRQVLVAQLRKVCMVLACSAFFALLISNTTTCILLAGFQLNLDYPGHLGFSSILSGREALGIHGSVS